MRIVYAALDQCVPGTTGGSVHVAAVARVSPHWPRGDADNGDPPFPEGLPLARAGAAARAAPPRVFRGRLRVAERARGGVIERYHNFGGEGVRAAIGVAVLESTRGHRYPARRRRARQDAPEPMRRWRTGSAAWPTCS
jgi:hypothetical protein